MWDDWDRISEDAAADWLDFLAEEAREANGYTLSRPRAPQRVGRLTILNSEEDNHEHTIFYY